MSQLSEIKVPDIGDFHDIPVIEICVQVGDTVAIDDALITLESDKATMDVPSSAAGIVREIRVALGDRISEGHLVALIEASSTGEEQGVKSEAVKPAATPPPATPAPAVQPAPAPAVQAPRLTPPPAPLPAAHTHASPSVRQFARELGVELGQVPASGPKGRILKEDVTAFIKRVMQTGGPSAPAASAASALGGSLDLLPWPKVDFARFGEVEMQPLSRIKKISGQNLARNWVMIPAVTYHEDADVTELEAFRQAMNKESEKSASPGQAKITLLAFLIKACALGLKQFPEFNSSLVSAENGELSLALKKYVHIAFAADTPNGLVVPVIKNVDQKTVSAIAAECSELARKARDGKLTPAEMSGACFTISSLGGIGGTAFSPIVNAPEVAILGVNKTTMKPVWNGKEFVPRLILPLSLSADHRVIDGALASRFNVYIAQLLADIRRALV